MKSNLHNDFEIDGLKLINFINLNAHEAVEVRRMRNHPEVRKWMYDDAIISKSEHACFIRGLKKGTHGDYYWLAKDGQGNKFGVIYFKKLNRLHKNAYLGIYVNMYRKIPGAGTKLIAALKKITFGVAKLHTLKLEVLANNFEAVAFYKRSGFVNEGKLKEFVFKDGHWVDVVIMGINEERRVF